VASQVKLCESPDFGDAIAAAANHFSDRGLTEQFIEKDYYITEALRIIAWLYPDRAIFKGGTSLSKGWNLIERFSEDIDLFLNPHISQPSWGQSKIDKALKAIAEKVATHPGLQQFAGGRSERGVSRSTYYTYPHKFVGNLPNRILLEMGIRSGDHPVEPVQLSSFLANFLQETSTSLDAEDETPFTMLLLHFRRTFVEKLFAIHNYIEAYQRKGTPFDKYARHYYDLYQLAQRTEVRELLKSKEFSDIKQDCDRISQIHFEGNHCPPENLSFANSPALFSTGELRKAISIAYIKHCQVLCYGKYPSWEEVEECFISIRNKL
jgi:predicted nucleotidyltransferase component of viral defense system